MTHKIKVQMFGNFRMDYNGAPFVAEKMQLGFKIKCEKS